MKRTINHFKVWGNDYTVLIYCLKVMAGIASVVIRLFTKPNEYQKLNSKYNIFARKRIACIDLYNKPLDDAFDAKFLKGGFYDFKGIKLPKIKNRYLMRTVYEDTLKIYTEFDDNYSYTIVDQLEKDMPEGTYCYIGKCGEEILVHPGDVVIDAGAWIGDFSAYAYHRGAFAYAFEPSPSNRLQLEQTITLNAAAEGIKIEPFGLGEKTEYIEFYENTEDLNTGGNSFTSVSSQGNIRLPVITLDNWVKENNIEKINFIKADIEGYERFMLRGATEVLRRFEPILSICTYHFPEDPTLLAEIIKKANPRYQIIQRKMKLFAFVPKK